MHKNPVKTVIHRDLKPWNILYFKKDNLLKIADFDISKEIPSASKTISLTKLKYTPNYVAPEMLRSNAKYKISVDFWGVGLIMF